jgi:hypothetical protein
MSKNHKPQDSGASERTRIVKRPRPELEPAEGEDPTATLIHRPEDLERTRQATQAMAQVQRAAEEGTVAIPVMPSTPEPAPATLRLDRAQLPPLAPAAAPAEDRKPAGFPTADPTSRVMVPLSELARMVEARPTAPPEADQTARLVAHEPELKLTASSNPDLEPKTSLMPVELQAPHEGTQILHSPLEPTVALIPDIPPASESDEAEQGTTPIERPSLPAPASASETEGTAPIQRPLIQDLAAAQSTLVLPREDATRLMPVTLPASETESTAPIERPLTLAPETGRMEPPPPPDATRIVPVAEMLALAEGLAGLQPQGAPPASESGTAPIERPEPAPADAAAIPMDATVRVPLGGMPTLEAAPVPTVEEPVATPAQATVIVPLAKLELAPEPASPTLFTPKPGPEAPSPAAPLGGGTLLVPVEELSALMEVPAAAAPERGPEPPPLAPPAASNTMKVAPTGSAPAMAYASAPAPAAKAKPGQGLLWTGVLVFIAILAGGGLLIWKPWAASGRSTPTLPSILPQMDSGRGLPPNLKPYLDKAKAGDAGAMRYLGACYYNGLGVPADRAEGLRWYRKAAEAGSQAARRELIELEAASKQ